MLTELRISGLGVIDDAVLHPHPGFTAVTGETGAGKTMVVTALGLISGGRGDAGRVRAGSDRAVVEARLSVPDADPVWEHIAATGGRADEDGSIILIRSVGADGRSRAHVGGRSAPVGALVEITAGQVAVHGQAEAIGLLQPAQQRAVLDRFARTDAELADYRTLRAQWGAARAELAQRTADDRIRAQREQLLRLGVAEIDRVAPTTGEDTELVAAVRRLQDVGSLRAAAQSALAALTGDETDASHSVALVDGARRALEAGADPAAEGWIGSLRASTAVLVDVAAELAAYLDGLDADPERLEQLLTRQAALRGLTRRYGADLAAVLDWRAAAVEELAQLDSSEHVIEALHLRIRESSRQLSAAAVALSDRRQVAASALGRDATAELAQLAMARATLTVSVERRRSVDAAEGLMLPDGRTVSAGADGIDTVEFRMTAHPSAPELPVARGASGGELSRVMLAIEVVLAGADPVATLVFDEVDAGVGGRAATEIGRRLARLACDHQVIVVTHLAQVAAFADLQVMVEAGDDGAVRGSSLQVVADRHRERELARMLGGTEGETARTHAAELLAAARSAI